MADEPSGSGAGNSNNKLEKRDNLTLIYTIGGYL